jgi:hypothetical protein
MAKTRDELQQEYTRAALELGNLVYQNDVMSRQQERNQNEIEKLQRKMRDLSLEAEKMQSAPAPQAEVANEQA